MKNQIMRSSPSTLVSRLVFRAIAFVVASAVLVTGLGGGAAAATPNEIGGRGASEAYCHSVTNGRATISVAFPTMWASHGSNWGTDTSTITIGGTGGAHIQNVGTRPWLYRWNGTQWLMFMNGPLLVATVGEASLAPWGYGEEIAFPIAQSGYYRVAIEYFWYTDTHTPGGYLFEWAPHVDLRRMPSQQSVAYCTY